MVQNQGGDISYLENTDKFEKAQFTEEIGKVACNLGAGRIKKEDNIDYAVGIELDKKVGTKVQKGEILGKIHANDTTKLEIAKKQVNDIIKISPEYCKKIQTIIEKI